MFGVEIENARYIIAGVIALVWGFVKTLPYQKSVAVKTGQLLKRAWSSLGGKKTSMNAWTTLSVAAIVVVLAWPSPRECPVPEPVKAPDVIDTCVESNRELLSGAIKDFAGEKYETVQAAEDAMNQKILDVYQASFDPLFKKINEARKADKLVELAIQIKDGEVR